MSSSNHSSIAPVRTTAPFNPYARKRPRPNPTSSNNDTQQQQQQQPPVEGITRTSYQQPQQYHRPTGSAGYGENPFTHNLPISRPCGRSNAVTYSSNVSSNNDNNSAGCISVNTAATATTSEKPSSVQLAPEFPSKPLVNSKDNHVNGKRDSFDDGTIDWDAFIQVADKAVAEVTSSNNNNDDMNKHQKQNSRLKTSKRQEEVAPSSPIIDLTQQDAPTVPAASCLPSNSCQNSSNSIGNTTCFNQSASGKKPPPLSCHNHNKKPPPVPKAAQQNPPPKQLGSNGVASLRPPSWSNTATTVTGTSTIQNSKTSADTPVGKTPAGQLSQHVFSHTGKACSPGASNLDPLILSLPKELRYNREQVIQPVKDSHIQNLVKHANLSAPLANGWTLFSHQKKAILRGLQMRRFVLALDMGLGKTLIGCVWAKSFQRTFDNLKVIVICPVSVKQEWARTAEEATGLQVEKDASKSKKKGKKKATTDDGNDEDNIYPKVQICSWAKVPTSVDETYDNYVVVCDEAHSLQSMQAGRTKDLLKLVKPQRCVGVLLLTGTPMKNGKPSNLFPLLKAVRHPLGNHQKAYEMHFCAGREKQFGRGQRVWDASGSSNLDQLRELASSHLLRLTKDECLKDLPPARREHKHVPVGKRLDADHNKALMNLARIIAMPSTDNDAVLGAFTTVRAIGAMAKIDATVELAKKILEEEPAIVIFTSFVKVAKTVHSKLASGGWAGELLTGETPTKDRQKLVDNFQEGISPVFVCTFGAGGVGLTLTAARTIILIDRPWTPGETHQAEDRIRRIGQAHAVRSIWMTAFDVDKHIDAMIEQKTQATNTVLDKSQKDAQTNGLSAPAPKVSIFQFVRNILRDMDVLKTKSAASSSLHEGIGPNLSQSSMHAYMEGND